MTAGRGEAISERASSEAAPASVPRHPVSSAVGLYTPEERARRDATRWTTVQAVLAPIQFLVFLVSTVLVLRFLFTGAGEGLATVSILLKTLLLYLIMVTGSIWEKVVFGKWLFAEPFWWEDFVSFIVIALHTLYLAALVRGWWSTDARMLLALAAYAVYAVNATQFLLKLRAARLQERTAAEPAGAIAA